MLHFTAYLRLISPELPFEQKKIMATELTEALGRALGIPPKTRERIRIQFVSYRPDEMAVGGRLVSEIEEPVYRLEVFGEALYASKRERLLYHLKPLLEDLLSLDAYQGSQLEIVFPECAAIESGLSAAGKFYGMSHPRGKRREQSAKPEVPRQPIQ